VVRIGETVVGRIRRLRGKYSGPAQLGEAVIIDGLMRSPARSFSARFPRQDLRDVSRNLGFHAAWDFGAKRRAITNTEATQMLYRCVPPRLPAEWTHARRLTPHMISCTQPDEHTYSPATRLQASSAKVSNPALKCGLLQHDVIGGAVPALGPPAQLALSNLRDASGGSSCVCLHSALCSAQAASGFASEYAIDGFAMVQSISTPQQIAGALPPARGVVRAIVMAAAGLGIALLLGAAV